MRLVEKIGNLWSRANAVAGQFYTPRELRALILFILAGIAIFLFRFGKETYYSWFPNQRSPQEKLQKTREDSLFFALSALAKKRDSLFFSLPEDSLLPASIREKAQHHSKEDGLRPHSISLNLAKKEDFVRLPTVGPASAERILEYCSERGKFRSIEELKNVHGFGETRFERMRRYLRLD